MIKQEIIDAVLARANIVDIIGQDVTLKKNGSNYVCCCPFHHEKTPSFHVNATRQSWHCFGACAEGGNVISYIMKRDAISFPESVKKLAAQYSIVVDEEPEAPEQLQERLKREALYALNERVAKFYASQICAQGKDHAVAWNYAVARFGQEYIKEVGVGHAPDSWHTLYYWAMDNGENIDNLLELGLLKRNAEKGTLYDFYRGRLMVPIRDKMRRVIGFTARRLDDTMEDVAKYLNSSQSPIYDKSSSIFGIDIAFREAAKQELFYLVEGAPDVMKMQSVGINNVVAPLGGHWNEKQFQQLKKIAPAVCFINDADPVPQGKKYGTGIEFVLNNGRMAIMEGLAVTVREIPNGSGNTKQDPGDFFTSKQRLRTDTKEEDFIVWSANKLYDKEAVSSRKAEVIRHISELASYINDDMRIDMLLPELTKIYKGKEFWKNAINNKKWDRLNQQQKKDEIDLRKYGFFEERGCYYGRSDKGDVQWSNFTMTPLFHIKDKDSPRRIFLIRNCMKHEEMLDLSMEELTSVNKFQQRLAGVGNFIWEGNGAALIRLLKYLFEHTETATQVHTLGWHQSGFYAWGNGIWKDDSFYKADDYGVCHTADGNWYIPSAAKVKKEETRDNRGEKFVHLALQNIKLNEYTARFVEVYGENGKIGLCYWLASLFRDIITAHTRSFPILDLFGPKGSGKTELGAALTAFFVMDNKAANIRNATATALNDEVAVAANAIVHLDEYKNDIRPDKIEFLKGLYDGVDRLKMGGANYESRIMTSVKSGVVISGQEMPTADIALFHRCIFLSFPRSEFAMDERKRFAELREVQKMGLTHLTLDVLKNRKRMEALYLETYNAVLDDINVATSYAKLETRIVENWAKVLAAYRVLEPKLTLPFKYEDILGTVCDGIRQQNQLSTTGNELAQFWNTIQYLLTNGEIFEGADFKIAYLTKLNTDISNYSFQQAQKVIMLNRSRVFMLYKKACLQMDNNPLPEDSLMQYLKNSDYYLGLKKSVRFKRIVKGVTEREYTNDGKYKDVESVLTAMVFQYELIEERYGVQLEKIVE